MVKNTKEARKMERKEGTRREEKNRRKSKSFPVSAYKCMELRQAALAGILLISYSFLLSMLRFLDSRSPTR